MDKHPVLRKIWCENAWVGAPWACGDHHHHSKENFEHREHWCANAWVGAPWACGDHHDHHSKENFEHHNSKKILL